jgi:hypothetical protein
MTDDHPVQRMTREEFIREYGHIPQPESVGMVWIASDQKTIAFEVIFTDNWDVEELERLWKLQSGESR